MKKTNKRGGILIYILGIIAILSLIVTEFLSEVTQEVQYRAQTIGKEDLREVAWNTASTIMAQINAIRKKDKGLFSLLQLSKDNIKTEEPDDYKVNILFKDETAKMSIYEKNRDLLYAIFEGIGIDYVNRQNLTNQLTEYLKKQPKLAFPANGKMPPKSENNEESRVIYNFSELYEINAFKSVFWKNEKETELFKKFKRYVSLYHKEKININTTNNQFKSILTGNTNLAKDHFFKNERELSSETGEKFRSDWIGYEIKVLEIKIEVLRGPVKLTMTILLDLGKDAKSMQIIALRESL